MKKHFKFSVSFLLLIFLIQVVGFSQQPIKLDIKKSCFQGVVDFEVLNVGKNISPEDSIFYIVIEDHIIARTGQVDSLSYGNKFTISLPAQGVEYKLTLQQGSNNVPFNEGSLVCDFSQMKRSLKYWSIGLQAGTAGPGLSIEKQFNNSISLRASGTYLPYSFTWPSPYEYSNLDVSTQITTAGLMFDWFVGGQPNSLFHLTAGGIYNLSELYFLITPTEEWVSNAGNLATLEEIGQLEIWARPQKINPYLGLGIGRMGSAVKKVGGKFEMGVFYTGSPEIQMKATGAVEPTAEQAELIESNVSEYKWYPNINFVISFKL